MPLSAGENHDIARRDVDPERRQLYLEKERLTWGKENRREK